MPKALEDVVARISNLAQEIKFFDLLTYVFITRAFELELLKECEIRNLEEVQNTINVTRRIDFTIFNTIRQLYPFLLSLEAKEGVQVGKDILKIIHGIEKVQAELDMLILKEAMNGRIDEVYEVYDDMLKMLVKSMVLSNELLLKPRK